MKSIKYVDAGMIVTNSILDDITENPSWNPDAVICSIDV